jgi:micrococcal nuclease
VRLIRILVRLFFGRKRRNTYRTSRRQSYAAPYKSLPPSQPRPIGGRAEALIVAAVRTETIIKGRCWVVDGDTIVIDDVRLRLAGIDAPELDHPYGKQSKWALVQLCKGQTITARIKPESSYDRVVAECYLPDGRDLAAELVRSGLAIDWPKFSGGKYRHLEPPGVRKKLWRCDARQRGRLVPQGTL